MRFVTLGDLLARARARRAGGGDYPVLSMTMHGGLVTQTERFKKRIASADTSEYKVVEHGQLVVGFPINEGVLDFQLEHEAAVVSPAYGIWDVRDESLVDRPYLQRYLTSPHAIEYYVGKMKGSTARRRSLPPAEFDAMPVPLPPVREQRRIAAILDVADAIRAKRRRVLAHLDEVPASTFRVMFDGAKPTATVDEFANKMRTGPFGSQLLHSEFVDEGIAVLGLDNVVGNEFRWAERRYISSEKYEQLKRYTVEPGDVLISIMGTTGRCVVVPSSIPTAINTKHICAITVDRQRLHPEFLRAAFLWHPGCRDYLARQTKGSIMNGLNMGIIKSMPIPAPALSLQREFADRIQHIAERRAAAESASRLDDELFASLQSRAFRGEL